MVYEVLRTKVRIFLDLYLAHAELASGYRELERRVTERTAQLQAANLSEQRLRREAEELSRLKDEFLSTMSHELRTPLNAIFGWITLLRTGRLDAATAERALETIERNARSQKTLIDDLLDVSRIVSGQVQLELTEFDPRQVVESALATMRAGGRRTSHHAGPGTYRHAAPLRADFTRLQQVACNLLSNAIKFTPEGGRVSIRMDRDRRGRAGHRHRYRTGVSADFLPHVFDRFRQEDGSISRRHSGLGLGLAIVRHLVELHGGTVAAAVRVKARARPSPSAFRRWMRRPVPCRRRPLWMRRGFAGSPALRCWSWMMMPDRANVVASMLQGYGARVTTAVDSGERALSLLMQHPPDVLIADLAMPQMTGIDLIQRIRALRSDQGGQVPAIAVSAFAAAPDRLLALQAGFDSHVGKPVEPEELALVLVDTLQRR